MGEDICCQICNQYSDELTFENFKHCSQNGWYCDKHKPYDKCINDECELCHYQYDLTLAILFIASIITPFLKI